MQEKDKTGYESFEEEAALEKEVEDVKRLNTFKVDNNLTNRKRDNFTGVYLLISGVFMLIAGIVMFVICDTMFTNGYYDYTNGYNDYTMFFNTAIVTTVFGAVVLLFGTISYFSVRSQNKAIANGTLNKTLKKKHKAMQAETMITSRDNFRYALSHKADSKDNTIYVDQPVIPYVKPVVVAVKDEAMVSPLADLEDEEEAYVSNVQKVVRNYDFFDLTSKNLMERFVECAQTNQLIISNRDAMNFLSHLAYSRFLLLRGMTKDNRQNFALSVRECLGAHTYYFDCSFIFDEKTLVNSPDFEKAFQDAETNEDGFVFMFLNNVSSQNIKQMFKDFLYAIFDKNNRHKVKYGDKQFTLSSNLYFVLMLPQDTGIGLYTDSSVLRYAPLIDIDLNSYTEGELPNVEEKTISVSDFHHVLTLSKGNYPFDESVWKKLDALSSFVNKIARYHIDNDIANNLEKHIDMNMSVFESLDDIVDEVLACDLLPSILRLLPQDKVFGEEDTLEQYMNENFMSEYSLPLTEKIFKDYAYALAHPVEVTKPGEQHANTGFFGGLAHETVIPTEDSAEPNAEEPATESNEDVDQLIDELTSDDSASEEPKEEVPAEETPAEEQPETPKEETPVESAPEEQPKEESQPVAEEEKPVEEPAPEAEPAVEEKPAEEQPVEETPVTEEAAPAEEVKSEPVPEEAPVSEEAPVEEPKEEPVAEEAAPATEETVAEEPKTESAEEPSSKKRSRKQKKEDSASEETEAKENA